MLSLCVQFQLILTSSPAVRGRVCERPADGHARFRSHNNTGTRRKIEIFLRAIDTIAVRD